jgi:glucose/arabinose dehydrogenase
MRINNPQFNHTGGALAFGPDGMLYIALGDGGGEDDQDGQIGLDGKPTSRHGPNGTGQNFTTPLGSILRVDPTQRAVIRNAQRGYSLPTPPNPAFDRHPEALPELFAKGLRNPFRISFDAGSGGTGQLFVADVGQNDVEEVDIVEGGKNYGWRLKEGTFLFDPAGFAVVGSRTDGQATTNSPGTPAGPIDPIAEHDHQEGRAVIGGFVYRGNRIPQLRGSYVFGNAALAAGMPQGRLFHLMANNEIRDLMPPHLDMTVFGFGQDADGELYVVGNKTGVACDVTGELRRIVP